VSPQISNRQALLEGALRCIEERGYGEVSTRDIARAARANVASIAYHFGSKDALMAEALAEGFRRWFAEFVGGLTPGHPVDAEALVRSSVHALGESTRSHRGLAQAFMAALARAPHDEHLRAVLAESYREARASLADVLELGAGERGRLRAGTLIAMFDGLLIQWLLDPEQGRRDERELPSLLAGSLAWGPGARQPGGRDRPRSRHPQDGGRGAQPRNPTRGSRSGSSPPATA
jgi:AcrR family transcriptional regulator